MELVHELLRCFLPAHEAFMFMWLLSAMGLAALWVTIERWLDINERTDYDASILFEKVRKLIDDKKLDEAYQLCATGGKRALPRILGSGIRKAQIEPALVTGAMAEESVHMTSALERRLGYLVMFGNSSTLLGLLGTVFGLIMSFAAVGQPNVSAVEKTALLATGISAAMNATLTGLSISIPCVLAYSILRSKVDAALQEIDRYALAILKLLNPPTGKQKTLNSLTRRIDEEEIADTDVTPMLNLMVMLIPFLLTSSEFVKIGAIELKLPEAQGAGGGGGGSQQQQNAKLDVGVVVSAKGFSIFSYFKTEAQSAESKEPDIPLVKGEYDFVELNKQLAEIKRKALVEIIKVRVGSVPEGATLLQLYNAYLKRNLSDTQMFPDHEAVKIVAEEQVKYKVVVQVMDAARGTHTENGNLTMFPNVSIAGGIIQ